MPNFKEGNIPLYFQFYLELKNNILMGDFKPGSQLPTINELNEIYGISHVTVRKSLELLRNEGLIQKKRGVGTRVRENVNIDLLQPKISLKDAIARLKESSDPKVLSAAWDVPPPRIANYLEGQSSAYRRGKIYIEHVYRGQGQDFGRKTVIKNYIPASTIKKYGAKNFNGDYFLIITEKLGAKLKGYSSTCIIRPGICDVDTAKLLGIPDGTPIFLRTYIYKDRSGQVVYVSEDKPTANNLIDVNIVSD